MLLHQALEIARSFIPHLVGSGVAVYLVRRHYLQELAKLQACLVDAQATAAGATSLAARLLAAEFKRKYPNYPADHPHILHGPACPCSRCKK